MGRMTSVLDGLKVLISNTSQWQTLTGTVTPAAAAAFIHTGYLRDMPTRPFLQLSEVEDSMTKEEAATSTYLTRGEIDVLMTSDIDSGNQNDDDAAIDEARDDFYDLLHAIQDQSGQANDDGSRMGITVIEQESPAFIDTSQQADNQKRYVQWQGTMRVAWGHRGGA